MVGALGEISRRLDTWLDKLGITINTGLRQKTALLGKARILRKVLESCRFFWFFFPIDEKTSAPEVFCSCLFISRAFSDKFNDGQFLWLRDSHRPPAAPPPIKYTSSCREDQRLSTEGKIVWKCCNISNAQGAGVHQPPLYHGGWKTACARLSDSGDILKRAKQK